MVQDARAGSRWLHRAIGVLACALVSTTIVRAQDYPSRPIKVIVPAAPGGGTDVLARQLTKVMSEQGGATLVVENRPGASGSIGVQAAINAPPDGYTIMVTLPDATTLYPLLKKKPPYDVTRDLTPIAQIAFTPVLFAVSASSPYKTVKDVVETSKTKTMPYGSNGMGTVAHLWIELFKVRTGARMVHIPYKGAAPSLQALIAGEHEFLVASPATLKAQLDAGRVRPIAVASEARLTAFPDVPTMIESGYPGFVVGAWFGVFGPAKLPQPIADKLHDMVAKAMTSADYQKQAQTLMFQTPATSRADFATLIGNDAAEWRKAIEAARIEPED